MKKTAFPFIATTILMATILSAAAGCEEGSEDQSGGESDLDADTEPAAEGNPGGDRDTEGDSDFDGAHKTCRARSTRIGPTVCGEIGLGRLEQKRKGNTWIDTEICIENKSSGGPCHCDGRSCILNQDDDITSAKNIVGCDNLPDDWDGAVKTCLRSDIDSSPRAAYYTNGYCSLIAIKCTGPKLLCRRVTSSEMDFDEFTTCPVGMVMLTYSSVQKTGILDIKIDLRHKSCLEGCDCDADCRGQELDAVVQDAPTQYQCVKKKGIGFCADSRNVAGKDYAVQQF